MQVLEDSPFFILEDEAAETKAPLWVFVELVHVAQVIEDRVEVNRPANHARNGVPAGTHGPDKGLAPQALLSGELRKLRASVRTAKDLARQFEDLERLGSTMAFQSRSTKLITDLLEGDLARARLFKRQRDLRLLVFQLLDLEVVGRIASLVRLVAALPAFILDLLIVGVREAVLVVGVAPEILEHLVKLVQRLFARLLGRARGELRQDGLSSSQMVLVLRDGSWCIP